jgi:hypothetical protein
MSIGTKVSDAIKKVEKLAAELGGLEELETIVDALRYEPEAEDTAKPRRTSPNALPTPKKQAKDEEVLAAACKCTTEWFTRQDLNAALGRDLRADQMRRLVKRGVLKCQGNTINQRFAVAK